MKVKMKMAMMIILLTTLIVVLRILIPPSISKLRARVKGIVLYDLEVLLKNLINHPYHSQMKMKHNL